MSTRNLILERNSYAFHSASAFGKIVEKASSSLSVAAGSTGSVSIAHSYGSYPQIVGWCQIDGSTNRIPIRDTSMYSDAELSTIIEAYWYTGNSSYGFFAQNDSASTVNFTFNYWLYFI